MAPRSERDVEAQLEQAAQGCVRQGIQLTELRRHVLRLVLQAKGPLTAYQLLDLLKETRKTAAPPTIYRALDFLVEQQLIHKVERLAAFIPCVETGHHHAVQFLICNRCGTVAEMEDRSVSRALERAAEREGFHPGVAVVEVDGTCAACWQPG